MRCAAFRFIRRDSRKPVLFQRSPNSPPNFERPSLRNPPLISQDRGRGRGAQFMQSYHRIWCSSTLNSPHKQYQTCTNIARRLSPNLLHTSPFKQHHLLQRKPSKLMWPHSSFGEGRNVGSFVKQSHPQLQGLVSACHFISDITRSISYFFTAGLEASRSDSLQKQHTTSPHNMRKLTTS